MSKYTPTDQQVEDSFAYDPEYEYHRPDDPGYHYRNRAAYKCWLAEHDRQVAESAWDEGHLVHGEHYRHNGYCRDSGGCIAVNPYRKEQEESKK